MELNKTQGVEFLRNRRKNLQIGYEGHIYNKHCKERWRCTHKKNCPGLARYVGGVFSTITEHKCKPNVAEIKSTKAKNLIIEEARTSQLPTLQIISDNLRIADEETISSLPLQRTLRRNIAKVRNPVRSNPNFTDISEIYFPDDLIDLHGISILMHDSGSDDPDRFFIFVNPTIASFGDECQKFQMDGTFNLAPRCFNNGSTKRCGQVLTIQGRNLGILVPLFYILMPKRTSVQYVRVLQIIADKYPNIRFKKMMVDLEMATIKAINKIFPDCSITLCYYHFQESLFSWLSSNGMKSRHQTDINFRFCVNLFGVMAFVPLKKLDTAYESLLQKCDNLLPGDSDLLRFKKYFEKSFMGRKKDGQMKNPKYTREMWNQYKNVLKNDPRTNNNIEGWHNALNHIHGGSHPTVFKFVKIIKEDMERSRLKVLEVSSGNALKPKRQTYKQLDSKIFNICEQLRKKQIGIESFMSSIARVYHFY